VLNWAVRYYPILSVLKSEGLLEEGLVLEIGSGPIGIGGFRKIPFIGCDLSFAFKPKSPMFPIKASATQLPFADRMFDVVIASDVLEHVPPSLREQVIAEAVRVANKLVIFAFPSGEAAWVSDRELLATYRKINRPAPEWLTEHMEAPFPGAELFTDIPGWDVDQSGNDSLKFHAWLMRREMSRLFCMVSKGLLKLIPTVVRAALKRTDQPPHYRQMFVLRRQPDNAVEPLIPARDSLSTPVPPIVVSMQESKIWAAD
jgi:Methyltransferase domain